jgi:23S rRNA pseudouridine955/2504/2580 synthase
MHELTISSNHETQRLDRFLKKEFPHIPYSAWARLCRKGLIRLDKKRCALDTRLIAGQVLTIRGVGVEEKGHAYPKKPVEQKRPKNLQAFHDWIIYEDQNLLAINKPNHVATQGGTKVQHHVDAYLRYLNHTQGTDWKLVHRLDKDTSGVLLIAKNLESARLLTKAFKEGVIEKTYLAITQGTPRYLEGEIKAPLKKRFISGQELMVEDNTGDRALTVYRVLEHAAKTAALLELFPKTGRTHQLRAHLLILGTPILGDPKYKNDQASLENVISKLHLHASSIKIPGIFGKKTITIKAPPPETFLATCKQLGFEGVK